MARNYTGLTGKKLIRAINRKNRHGLVRSLLYTPAALAAAGLTIPFMKDTGNYPAGVIVMLIALGIAAAFGMNIPRQIKMMTDAEDSGFFRTHGNADEIASLIESEYEVPLLDDEGTLICRSFIMTHGDFESFKRFEDLFSVNLQVYSKNGVPMRLYFSVTDLGGDHRTNPVKLKYQKEAEEILHHMKMKAVKANRPTL